MESTPSPRPTNKNLQHLFSQVDTIVIKDMGVSPSSGEPLTNSVLLTIQNPNQIKIFSELLEIIEPETRFACMCLGDYAIELISHSVRMTTIGFHHGHSIRVHHWDSDAELAKSGQLVSFLADLGFKAPLEQLNKEKQEREAEEAQLNAWLDIAPKCFTQYLEQFENPDFELNSKLSEELNLEFPEKQNQIIALLKTYGTSSDLWINFWSYELAPQVILSTFETSHIIDAYLRSDRNDIIKKGLARLICSREYKREREKHLPFIPLRVIDELELLFDAIGVKRGINEIFSLRNAKIKNLQQ